MSSEEASASLSRKRKASAEAEPVTDHLLSPKTKRRRLFWDNLSRLWLTPRALRELDRRTVRPAPPARPDQTDLQDIDPEELRRFAKHGGPALGDLRGFPEPNAAAYQCSTMDSSQMNSRKRPSSSAEVERPSKTRRSSAYDNDFEQHLKDHGVRVDNSAPKPSNWADIKNSMAQRRPSLSPSRFSEADFEKFRKINDGCSTEAKLMSQAFPFITGAADIPSEEGVLFGNLKDLTDGTLGKAKPDFYDGSRPEELKMAVREALSTYIVPSTTTTNACLPNFVAEVKGAMGLPEVCRRQAVYDGVLSARGIHELRSYIGQETPFDNNAYTIASTYHHTGILHIYAINATPPTDASRKYDFRITQPHAFAITGDSDSFRQGVSAFRNARDWAKEQRERYIAAANQKASGAGQGQPNPLSSSTNSFGSVPVDATPLSESDTSSDELARDIDRPSGLSPAAPAGHQLKSLGKSPMKR